MSHSFSRAISVFSWPTVRILCCVFGERKSFCCLVFIVVLSCGCSCSFLRLCCSEERPDHIPIWFSMGRLSYSSWHCCWQLHIEQIVFAMVLFTMASIELPFSE